MGRGHKDREMKYVGQMTMGSELKGTTKENERGDSEQMILHKYSEKVCKGASLFKDCVSGAQDQVQEVYYS